MWVLGSKMVCVVYGGRWGVRWMFDIDVGCRQMCAWLGVSWVFGLRLVLASSNIPLRQKLLNICSVIQ
jgi:hypothetical protein